MAQAHRQRFVPEHLPDQLQVAGLLQDAGRFVAPELVRAYLPRETGTDRKPVENVCAVRAAERAAVLVCEQVALRHGVPPGTEPGAKHLRCPRAEESRAVLLSLAAADRDSAFAEADVLNSQPQRFADTKAAVRKDRNKSAVPPALEALVTRLYESPDGFVLRHPRELLWRFHDEPTPRVLRQKPGVHAPRKERPELRIVEVCRHR